MLVVVCSFKSEGSRHMVLGELHRTPGRRRGTRCTGKPQLGEGCEWMCAWRGDRRGQALTDPSLLLQTLKVEAIRRD